MVSKKAEVLQLILGEALKLSKRKQEELADLLHDVSPHRSGHLSANKGAGKKVVRPSDANVRPEFPSPQLNQFQELILAESVCVFPSTSRTFSARASVEKGF